MRRFWLATASAVALGTAAPALAQPSSGVADPSGEPGISGASTDRESATALHLAPVEVTATKRDQNSFDVIGNVSVRTADELQAAVVTRTEDLGSVFPELSNMNRSARIYNNMTIRGQSSADFFSPGVGLYVDGVPQLSQSYAQSLLGIDRVELLKGPQGVIYGRGTLGGVLSMVTRGPGEQPGVWGGGDYYGRGTRAHLGASSGYHESGWAVQAMAMDERYFGSLDNPERGKKDVDTSDTTGGWASLHYRSPTRPLETKVRAGIERYRSHEEYFVPFSPLSRSKVVWSDVGATDEPSLRRVLKDISWDADYELSGEWSLKGIASYQVMDLDRLFWDGTDTVDSQSSVYSELRANYDNGDVSALMGMSFQKLRFEHENKSAGTWGMGGKMSNNDVYNYAVFVDGAWRFHPQWEVSAGARASLENAQSEMILVDGSDEHYYSNHDSFFSVTPRVALAWLPNDLNRVWVGLGQGFKPGGFNKEGVSVRDATAYKSETATNIEVGWKWHAPDWRHSAEVTGYGIFSRDVQGYTGTAGQQYLANMGNARSTGVEATWKSALFQRHVLSVGGMYNDARFTSGQYDGKRVAYAPRYSLLVAWDGLYGPEDQLRSRVAVRQNGPFHFNESNSLRQGSYMTLDASLMWDTGYGIEAGVYARNLLDKKYRTVAFEGVGAQLGAPRELGLQVSFRW
ncbi:TonB-dependent receptor [Phaeovibrio sulfidiphilus]|uniref:TonB-dependent receptor n=1 Tax=Phaeovibrio sulfidiphilus TaxID=1220600 RepID=A0A8J7CVJ0_9PROT|nr:TonB-dependent receptor [Phaeovibrio sulfidiphilus]MBE1236361.1 TonB-dependent receptor [Phaeovibrio sulfidiphilus]